MQNAISIFNFNQSQVRIQFHNGEPYFCLTDVAEILNIQNTKQSRFNLKEAGVHKMYVSHESGKKLATFINEPNLYRVIFRSNKPEAVKFQDWIFEEVIPQIRQTGAYSASPKPTKDERTGLRQAVTMLVGKADINHSAAYKLVHHRFGVASIEDLTHEQIPQAIEYVHRLILDGEVLDKPKNHTVALPEFELVRIAQYLSKTYLSMQLFHELHRALCMVSPHFTKRTREEVENNLPLLRGIVHHLQDYSGSLKDPFFNEQFAKSMQFLGRITPQCLAFR